MPPDTRRLRTRDAPGPRSQPECAIPARTPPGSTGPSPPQSSRRGDGSYERHRRTWRPSKSGASQLHSTWRDFEHRAVAYAHHVLTAGEAGGYRVVYVVGRKGWAGIVQRAASVRVGSTG